MASEARAAKLYLHIGTPKTGTTAIQQFCLANVDALARRGYCFPINTYHGNAPFRNGAFLVQLSQTEDGDFENAHRLEEWRERMDYLVGLLRKHDKVLLTEELIWTNSKHVCPGVWKNLKKVADEYGFAVKIIVYFRGQDQFISSHWAQRVKGGYSEPCRWRAEEAVARAEEWTNPDYYDQLEKIASVFGRECISARIYDRGNFPQGDIRLDFLEAIDLASDGEGFTMESDDTNPSLGGNALEIKRLVNAVPGFDAQMQSRAMAACFACYAEERKQVNYSILSLEERRAIMARYAESNRLLARDYFGDENRVLFPVAENQPPKWTPENPYMYESIVRFLEMMLQRQEEEPAAARARRRMRKRFRKIKGKVTRRMRMVVWKLKGHSDQGAH